MPRNTMISLTLAAVVVILAGIQAAETIVNPFLISLFIAAISAPMMLGLTHRGVPKSIALILVMSLIIALGGILSGLMGTSVDGFSRNLPYYQERLQVISGQLTQMAAGYGIELEMGELTRLLDLSAAMGFVGNAFNHLLGALTNAFLILLMVAFILLELPSFGDKIRRIADDPTHAMSSFGRFSETLNRYLVIKSAMSLATGATITVVLYFMGIDYPILWGIIAFMLNFVPNIGSVIAAIPAVLMALVQFGFGMAGWVVVVYLAANSVFGNVVEPRLMGRSLGLSTYVVFMSLVFWGWLLGPVGMFLSVPLTMTAKIAFESSEGTRWLAILLGGEHEDIPEAPNDDEPTLSLTTEKRD